MNYKVYQDDTELKIRTASIYPSPYLENRKMEYVQFPVSGTTFLTVRSAAAVHSAVIRPLSLGLKPELKDGTIRIRLDGPVKFSLEINGSCRDNLLVLAEKPAYEDAPGCWEKEKEEGRLLYFPAGVHDAGILTVTQDDTVVYLEEGAYVNGKLDLDHCDRVTVCGYGVLTMEKYPLEMRNVYQRCVNAMYCKDLTIRDITIMDSNDWSLRINGCENVLVDNVKIIGCRGNSDGVDVCGSRNVLVQGVFTRVWDDSLVVKALDTGDVENVVFRNCILWNDFARPMEVGVELRADHVRGVRFENIDVLHSPTGYPLMGIHHGDRARVEDIVFDNIRIEDAPGAQLFDIRIAPSYWNRDNRMGDIRNITFSNIQVNGRPGLDRLLSDSRLQGYSAQHDIQGVRFEKIKILGKTVHDAESCGLLCLEHVNGVAFRKDPEAEPLSMIRTRLETDGPFTLQEDGSYAGTVVLSLTNPSQEEREKKIRLEISPAHLGEYDRSERTVRLPAGKEVRIACPVRLSAGKYVLALQSEDPEIRCAWQYLALDCVLREWEEKKAVCLPFVNYFGERPGSLRMGIRNDRLHLSSELLKREDCSLILHAAQPVPRQEGEAVFSVEETDFGVVPAVLYRNGGYEAAPQLRCPLEITLVFKNEPKVKEIRSVTVPGGCGEAEVELSQLGLEPDTKHFWLEAELRLPELEKYRYPCTLFHSVTPLTAAHMYGNCVVEPTE
ncbi:MAG TPA: hypothetical protein H9926_10580 [Candidatus Eisenbergiella intestinigallinarum]|uniref:Uncharacterized protein n=1 Tax=Candidatus Eisenbergiella intestinigallinarum TaxID=2838549 RepID=A0A9D2QLT4_9FIRM|nr:hypothetical protein [Candidatus Eisenbergiella intestinigallinarum]